MGCTIICPTYNAGVLWEQWIKAVKSQKNVEFQVLIIDSCSKDETVIKSKEAGFEILEIPQEEFNHAGTRNRAAKYAIKNFNTNFLVFLTQDAILSSDTSLASILEDFKKEDIAAVCGRQQPHEDADPVAKHSRAFNYLSVSKINSKEDIDRIGLKAAYMSNSFAAYRSTSFFYIGGFPEGLIFGEDMFLAAKFLLAGFKTSYNAEAVVSHSHNYTLNEEFRRYFDIGVFHSSQPFLLENFGKPTGEGFKFALSEFKYCLRKGNLFWGVNSIMRTGLKFVGYKLGKSHAKFPNSLCKTLSMDKNYWKK